MISSQLGITEKTFTDRARKWLQVIRYNESGLIVNPVGDHFYTIPYLLHNTKMLRSVLGRYYKRYLLVYVELSQDSVSNNLKQALLKLWSREEIIPSDVSDKPLSDVIDLLVEKGYEIAFFLSRVEPHFIDQKNLMTELEILTRQHRVSVLYFSELNLTNKQLVSQQRLYPAMFQNVLFMPYYSREDVQIFIAYNEKLWRCKIPDAIKEKIITVCGGNLWLARQALRYYRNTGDEESVFSHYEILKKAVASFNQLFPDEQKVLYELIGEREANTSDRFAYDFLLKVQLLIKENDGYMLSIPLLEKVMGEQRTVQMLSFRKNLLYKADTVIDGLFTEKEKKILVYLLQNKNKLISREQIMTLVLGDKNYSAWALDQLFSRLRSKLVNLGFPKSMIRTKKGAGYVFS